MTGDVGETGVMEIPSEAIMEFTFEDPCPCCGHPKTRLIDGAIAASGRYHIAYTDNEAIKE